MDAESITTIPIRPLESQALSIHPAMARDDVLAIYDRLRFYRAAITRVTKVAEELMLEWIAANGPIEAGNGVRYVSRIEKEPRCVNVPGALEAILEAVSGDFDKTCELLTAQPIKYGAAKAVLGDGWDTYFQVTEKSVLDEKQPKKLTRIDEKFMR